MFGYSNTSTVPMSSYSLLGNIIISGLRGVFLFYTIQLYYKFRMTGGIFGNNFSTPIKIPDGIKQAVKTAGTTINEGLD